MPNPDYGILTRPEFIEEFAFRYEPGQHVIGLGPTGRGKTTLFGQILPHTKTTGTLISCLGRDPALCHLGKPIKGWPPKIPLSIAMYDEPRPFIRRYEVLPRNTDDFTRVRANNARMLYWMFSRQDWTIFFPDLQLITDPKLMNLGKEVEQLLLTLRKAKSSVWMDAQAPRWIPRAATDQVRHLFIWKNRDAATMTRLREISGLSVELIKEIMGVLDSFYDCLWIDVTKDEYYIVLDK